MIPYFEVGNSDDSALFHGVGPPLQGCVPLSSPTAPSLDIMPSQDIMPSHSFVSDFVSVRVLDNIR